jgi:hypothetical protein
MYVPYLSPPFSFTKLSSRLLVQPFHTMPRLAPNTSSSLDHLTIGDHHAYSLQHKTHLDVAYLQDMVLHPILFVVRVAVVLPATSTTSSFSSDSKGIRLWFFLLTFVDHVHIMMPSTLSIHSWRFLRDDGPRRPPLLRAMPPQEHRQGPVP